MKIIGSIIALTLAQCLLSGATPTHVIFRLLTRQTSGIDQCETPCSPIMNFVGAGQESCTPQACCTTTFEQDYLACFTCIGKAQNTTDYSLYQSQLDELTAACGASGISVPKLTFPGQDPNRPLPSLSPGSPPTVPGSTTRAMASITRTTASTTRTTASITRTTATNPPSSSTTSVVQTTVTVLPTTTASNSGKKNAVSHLGLLVISCIMIRSLS